MIASHSFIALSCVLLLLLLQDVNAIGIPFRRAPAKAPAGTKTFSVQDIKTAIGTGKYIVVLKGQVLDVSQFINMTNPGNHPGGVDLILSLIGLDLTKDYTDEANNAGHEDVDLSLEDITILGKFSSGSLGKTPTYPPGYKAKNGDDGGDGGDDGSDSDAPVSSSSGTPTADAQSSVVISLPPALSTPSKDPSINPSAGVVNNGNGKTTVYIWTSTVVVNAAGSTINNAGVGALPTMTATQGQSQLPKGGSQRYKNIDDSAGDDSSASVPTSVAATAAKSNLSGASDTNELSPSPPCTKKTGEGGHEGEKRPKGGGGEDRSHDKESKEGGGRTENSSSTDSPSDGPISTAEVIGASP